MKDISPLTNYTTGVAGSMMCVFYTMYNVVIIQSKTHLPRANFATQFKSFGYHLLIRLLNCLDLVVPCESYSRNDLCALN